jgi:hypothetical protein
MNRCKLSCCTLPLVALVTVAWPDRGRAADAEPAWLTEARAREGKLIEAKPFRSKDGALTGRVPAKLRNRVVLEDGAYYLELDVGAETPVSCEVLLEGFDLARMLRSTSGLTFDRLAEAQGKIDLKAIERTDAGAFGANPYIAVDWAYRTQTAGGPMLGGLKQVVVDMHTYGVYCSHVELGYAKTFAEIVRTLAGSLQLEGAPAAPAYVEVQTLKLGEQPVGVATWTLEADAEGDLRSLLSNSMIVPAGDGAVTAQDSAHLQWMTPEGALLNAMHVMSSNDETPTKLELRPAEGSGVWHVSGTFMGKTLAQDVGKEPPVSVLTQARARRDLLAGPDPVGKQLTDKSWTAADPTRLLASTFKVTGKDGSGRYTATETSGPLSIEELMDAATGTPLRMTTAIGPRSLQLERVYVHGTF